MLYKLVEISLWRASAIETRQRFIKATAILRPTWPHKAPWEQLGPKASAILRPTWPHKAAMGATWPCLLYTSDAADE